MRPSPLVNALIEDVLSKAQSRYGVEVFDYVIMSNHVHLCVRGEELSAFIQYFKANVARSLNRHLERRGPFWERRFSASPILDEEAQAERAAYIYSHGVKEGLVDSAASWPGLASVKNRLQRDALSRQMTPSKTSVFARRLWSRRFRHNRIFDRAHRLAVSAQPPESGVC